MKIVCFQLRNKSYRKQVFPLGKRERKRKGEKERRDGGKGREGRRKGEEITLATLENTYICECYFLSVHQSFLFPYSTVEKQ